VPCEGRSGVPVAGFRICRGKHNQTDQLVSLLASGSQVRRLLCSAQQRNSRHSATARITQGCLMDGCRRKAVSLCNNSKDSMLLFVCQSRVRECEERQEQCCAQAVKMRKAGAAASCVRSSSGSFQSWSVFTWMHPSCCAGLRRAFSHWRPLTAQAHPRDPQVRVGWNEKTSRRTGLRSLQSWGIMSPTRHYGPRPAKVSPSLDSSRQVKVGCGVQRWRLGEARRRLCSTGRAVHNHGQTCSEQGDMVHGEPECPLPSCGVAPTSSCARCGSLGFSPRSRPSLLLLA
jgi:hypothetical protein